MPNGNTPARHVRITENILDGTARSARHRAPKPHRGRLGVALLTPALTGALLTLNGSGTSSAAPLPATAGLAAAPTAELSAARLQTRMPTLRFGMRNARVLKIQRKLGVRPLSGRYLSRTTLAVKKYQTRNGLRRTGRADIGTYRRIMSGRDRRVSVHRASRSVRATRAGLVSPLASHRGLGPGYGASGRYWRRNHTGQDFRASYRTPVRSIAAGRITRAGWAGAYGYRVVVRHRDGSSSMYAHLSRIVRRGGKVNAGTMIGRVGSTGNSTGNHLHLEVRNRSGYLVSPLRYLRARGVRV